MKLINNTKNFDYRLIQGSCDIEITELVFDSRKIVAGCLFVCIKGAKFDSHDIVADVALAGAAAVVIEEDCSYPKGITVIRVDNSRIALAKLSAAVFDYPAEKLITIGVTGTKGKTTSTHMIKCILEKAGAKIGMIGTIGIFIGDNSIPAVNTTPESYEIQNSLKKMVDAGCTYAIMEVSSQGIMLHRTDAITFDYGIFTNISPDHIGPDEHKTFDEYLMYKTKFFDQCKIALINSDDEHSAYVIANSKPGKVYTYSENENSDFKMDNLRYVSETNFVGIEFDVSGIKTLDCRVGIPGRFNAYNALCSIGLCAIIGISDDILNRGLEHILVNGRMEIAYSSDKFKVIIDYAHNAVSMESLLNTLRVYNPKRLVVVFGCGGNRAKDRRYSMGEIAGKTADLSILTEDNSRFEKVEDIVADIKEKLVPTGGKYIEILNRKAATEYAITHAQDGDIIAIIGKGHETYQIFGSEKKHYSDQETVAEIIEQERKKGTL